LIFLCSKSVYCFFYYSWYLTIHSRMKLLSYKILIFYFLSTVVVISNEKPDIKNLIVHSQSKQISDVNFTNIDEEQITLKDFKGKLVILNFWATWCAPCREEMPSLEKLQSDENFSDLIILPVNIGQEKLEKAQNFFSELGIKNLNLYFDNSLKLAKSFSLRGVPTSIIINRNGEEFARIVGSIDFADKKFINWLENYN